VIAVACNLGIVTGYVINGYLDYYTVPYVVLAIFAVFYLGFPLAMASKGYKQVTAIPEELQTLKHGKPKLTMHDFRTKSARKAILIGVYLNFLGIGNGIVAVNNYSQTIFNEAGSSLSPKMSTILIGVILLIGSCVSSLFCDRAGRKPLMYASSCGCGLSLAILAIYSKLKIPGYE
jgi:MFS family permease